MYSVCITQSTVTIDFFPYQLTQSLKTFKGKSTLFINRGRKMRETGLSKFEQKPNKKHKVMNF